MLLSPGHSTACVLPSQSQPIHPSDWNGDSVIRDRFGHRLNYLYFALGQVLEPFFLRGSGDIGEELRFLRIANRKCKMAVFIGCKTASSEWALCRLLESWLLAFSGKQPFERLLKLSADCQQHLHSRFNAPAFDRRKVALTDTDPLCKFMLRDIKSAQFPNPSSYSLPIN